MNRNISFAEGEYYHVYNRGVEKRKIFLDASDRERFQRLLFVANSNQPVVFKLVQGLTLDKVVRGQPLVAIGAYVLMDNHFHILVKEIRENGLSEFLQKITTGYTMYFNKKNNRVGALFQGVFKAEHVDNDEYLKYLYAYIHLNPVKLIDPEWKEKGIHDFEKAKKYLEGYCHSSYGDYAVGKRDESVILSPEEFPDYFEKHTNFVEFVEEWMTYKQDKI